jgi:hypothetical protein
MRLQIVQRTFPELLGAMSVLFSVENRTDTSCFPKTELTPVVFRHFFNTCNPVGSGEFVVTDVAMSEPSSRFWRPGTKVAFAVRSQLPKPMPDCRIGALSGSGMPDFAIISARGR